ncbi:YozE family protein [Vagococcus sp.]|uniref:YozE family protein n=1 Tax=Vagococcus sp. TaxID=1933889 RepID=UPI003F967DA6
MKRSFYHYVQIFRDTKLRTEETKLAEAIFEDLQFPKQSEDYEEVSNYLETNTYYISDMTLFDELWETYLENN